MINLANIKIFFLLIGLFCYSSVWAIELGRLFTTSTERAKLDMERDNPTIPEVMLGETQKVEPPELPPFVVFDGIVVRDNGLSVAWVNGSQELSQEAFNFELDIETMTVSVYFPSIYKSVKLKPGQVFNTVTNEIQEYLGEKLEKAVIDNDDHNLYFSYFCKKKKSCKNINSCKEAYYQLFICGNKYLDSNKNEIPCDETVCLAVIDNDYSYSTGIKTTKNTTSNLTKSKVISSNCTWVKGYYRKNGTFVKSHERCK